MPLTDSQLQDAVIEILKIIGVSQLPTELRQISAPPSKEHHLHIQKGEADGERINVEQMRGFFGDYNAATNTPALSNTTGTEGTYYKVSVGGDRDFGNGIISLSAGSIIEFKGGVWGLYTGKLGSIITNTQIVDLGEIGTTAVETAFNDGNFQDPLVIQPLNKGFTLITGLRNGISKRWIFIGRSGIYDETTLATTDDFFAGNMTDAEIAEAYHRVTNEFTDAEKAKVANVPANTNTALSSKVDKTSIVDALTSTLVNVPLSANQGRVLKGFIDNINAVLNSDDTTLDELQELVNFIKQNKTDLDTLGISNIAGLVDALAGKQPLLPYTPANDSEVVKSVTGSAVDNTDPQNPVIDIPEQTGGLDLRASNLASDLTESEKAAIKEKIEVSLIDSFDEVVGSSTNILNPDTYDDGFFVNHLNGVLSNGSSYTTSDFTQIESSTTYKGVIKDYTTTSIFRKVAFYDANQNFISGLDGWISSFTTPSNAEYVKISTYAESNNANYPTDHVGLFLDSVLEGDYFDEIPTLKYISSKHPKSLVPKEDLLLYDFSVTLNQSGKSYLESVVEGKILEQEIRPFSGNVFDFLDVHYDGVIVKRSGDDAAPYRINGSTVGANHTAPLNRDISFYIDGKRVFNYNKSYFPQKTFTVKESYDIEGTTAGEIIAKVSISYEFDKYGGCTIYTDFLSVQDGTDINNIMFTQASVMEGPVSYYVPKTLPKTQDSITYDFSEPYDMTNFAPANSFKFRLSDCEPSGVLPDRLIMLRNDICFAHGYLQTQDAAIQRRRDVVEEYALEIRNNTKKSYPNAVDRTSGTILSAGEYYSVIAYRNYFIPKENTTASYIVKSNYGTFLYLDWHTTTEDRITLPNELSGLPYDIVEKSDSVSILSKENTGSIVFDVTTKGYVILRFSDYQNGGLTKPEVFDEENTFTVSPSVPTATEDTHAVNKAQMDAADANKLDKTANIQNLWTGTQAEYDAITTKSATTLYFIQ